MKYCWNQSFFYSMLIKYYNVTGTLNYILYDIFVSDTTCTRVDSWHDKVQSQPWLYHLRYCWLLHLHYIVHIQNVCSQCIWPIKLFTGNQFPPISQWILLSPSIHVHASVSPRIHKFPPTIDYTYYDITAILNKVALSSLDNYIMTAI